MDSRDARGRALWIGTALRLVTGGVWLVAGAMKITDIDGSIRAVRAYELLPEAIVPTVGTALPLLEVAIGLMLVLGLLVRANSAISAALFVAFVIGIASAWARGLEIDCGCFGGGGVETGASSKYPWEIARDLALMAASLWLVARPWTRYALDTLLFRSHEWDTERNTDGEELSTVPR